MFLSLVIGGFKDYFDTNIAKIIKISKTNCIYFNHINLTTILLIINYNNDMMRRLLKIIDNLARLIAVIDIGKTG
jgi:hypothetical protein